MSKLFILNPEREISILIENLSKTLNVDITLLNPIKETLTSIILKNKDKSLDTIMDTYFNYLEREMASLIEEKITPGFQFGIKNSIFSFTGYYGNFNKCEDSREIDKSTYFSFDSISKVLTSTAIMVMIRDGIINFDSTINSINPEFRADATIRDILKFTARLTTDIRIDGKDKATTTLILKRCKEDLEKRNKYKNHYLYSDIGFILARLSIPEFLEIVDYVLNIIDSNNLTYRNRDYYNIITGGRLGEIHFTPDTKGRDILYPGHTGLYGNIEGLLKLLNNEVLTKEELALLLEQPYDNPRVYTKDGKIQIGKNGSQQYMAKVAGYYRMPNGIVDSNYNKLASCDLSNLTTQGALASAGTCGSWGMKDTLFNDTYTGGILTNPYSSIIDYPHISPVPNTNLTLDSRGVIIGYSSKLNPYKEIITKYGIILVLLTQYLKNTNLALELERSNTSYVRKLKKPLL